MYLKFKVFGTRGVILQQRCTANQRLLLFHFPFFCMPPFYFQNSPYPWNSYLFCLVKSFALPNATLSSHSSLSVRLAFGEYASVESLKKGLTAWMCKSGCTLAKTAKRAPRASAASKRGPRGIWHYAGFVCEWACRFSSVFFFFVCLMSLNELPLKPFSNVFKCLLVLYFFP